MADKNARKVCRFCPALLKEKFIDSHERDAHYAQVRKEEVAHAE